jgi:RNA polymerase sigma-70 factor, ECF subfamily
MNEQAPLGQSVEELIERARTRDSEALGKLLETFRKLLLAQAHGLLPPKLRGKVGSSDLAQETIARAEHQFGQFRGTSEAELKGWLLSILRNQARNIGRKFLGTQKTDAGKEVALDDDSSSTGGQQQLAATTLSPSQIASDHEEKEILRKALDRLSEEERRVIELHRLQGLPLEEVARRLGLASANTAGKRFARALDELRRQYEAIGQEMLAARRKKER